MADPGYIVDGVLTDGEAWVGLQSTTTTDDTTAIITFTSTDDGQVGDWSQYMDLVLIIYGRNARADTGDTSFTMRFNNDTAGNYAYQRLVGNGSTATASESPAASSIRIGEVPKDNVTANIFAVAVAHCFDINSGKYKSVASMGAADRNGGGVADMVSSVWRNQAPITEIDLYSDSSYNWKSGSRIDLFGVLPRMVA
jgi:hypothetical protein